MLLDRIRIRELGGGEPPLVGGYTPLGCALAYRPDPATFLTRMVRDVGPVFTLDLAGLKMTIVADPELLGQVHLTPEAVLSARTAQAELGFERTLGAVNVRTATDHHRALLTTDLRTWKGDLFETQWHATRRAIETEWPALRARRQDLFAFARRTSIRVMLDVFVDPTLVANVPGFIERYFAFQDALEQATAKAMALPRALGDRFVLGPIERRREALVDELVGPLARAKLSPFFDALRARLPADKECRTLATIAIGFLFAAHKNPAIGAAQTLAFVLDHASVRDAVQTELRAHRDAERPSDVARPVLDRSLKETLRLTQHSIGAIRRVEHEPYVMGRFRLPVGRYIGISHAALGRAPSAFADPLRFDPDRFLSERATHRTHPYAFIPFSSGVHACPGQRSAMSFMRAFVTEVLARAEEVSFASPLPPLDFRRATLAQRRGPVFLAIGHNVTEGGAAR